MSAKSKRKFQKTIEIKAPATDVWKAITDAKELTRWFPLQAYVKPGPDGEVHFTWGDKFNWKTRIEVWRQEKHLRLVYTLENHLTAGEEARKKKQPALLSDSADELAIDYYLEARGGKTVLTLVHSGFGAGSSWDDEYDGVSRGWNVELNHLKHYLENHAGHDRAVAWVYQPFDEPFESVWQKLMGADGLLASGSLSGLSAGDSYAIRSAAGDEFSGKILIINPPLDFTATVDNLDASLLRVHIERYRGVQEASLWLYTYTLSHAKVQLFEKTWQERLRKLLRWT